MGLRIKIGYKEEKKPSLAFLIVLSLIGVFCIVVIYLYFFSFDTETIFKTILLICACITIVFLWMKEYKAYKSAIVSQNRIIKEGKKYKGNIIETEKTAHFLHSRKGEVTVFEYRAVIEYINDKGETIRFTTPELIKNPENLATKEVTVYNLDSVDYATDFGYYQKPKRF
ncbi:MAG: hypothetical protein PHD46_04345 [Eubacteriales bacterium]|nr:hypothetical protein [Eubacteriales bacterium]MDD4422250.1 hypothetical protein [Eubacteriales bacterium]